MAVTVTGCTVMTCRSAGRLLRGCFATTQLRSWQSKNRGLVTSIPKLQGEDKKLFTPGPLGVSLTTRQAMLRDLGSRDTEFISSVQHIRDSLVNLAGVTPEEYTCVPVQGSGTFSIEAVLSTVVPRDQSRVLILENGAYGRRQARICEVLGIRHYVESFAEDQSIDPERVAQTLIREGPFNLVALVHCETSSGVFNPIRDVGEVIKRHNSDCVYFVDAMSSFGAVPLGMASDHIDYMVSSANKCIEGVPGFSYVIARTDHLISCKGQARSYSLDLVDQYEGLKSSGQFRFTPPTHAMLGFCQALKELEQEGGVAGRAQRYQKNRDVLREGMRRLGFREFLDDSHRGYIITSYCFPKHHAFNFKQFYEGLSAKGQVIYPGKVLDADCFRIGNIGHLYPDDMQAMLRCVEDVCADMGLPLPVDNADSGQLGK